MNGSNTGMKFSSYLTENKLRLHYKDQPSSSVKEIK